jgi:hypothetical protein
VADQSRSEASAAVVGMNIDLFEMHGAAFDELDVREPHRNIVGEDDPQMTLALSPLENVRAGRFAQDTFRRVPREELSGGQFDRRQS